MATRQSIEDFLDQCKDVVQYANDQYEIGSMQEHYNDDNYIQAMQQLEEAYNDLEKLALSANAQQREQLIRMRLQLQHVQSSMIRLDH